MNPDGGYTRSYRRKWDNPIFANKQQAAVWAWMCDVAQYQAHTLRTKYGPVELQPGELVMSERELSEDFNLHRNTLRALLNRMVDEGMISLIRDRIPHRAGTIVRIVKYVEYQGFNGATYEAKDRKNDTTGTEGRTVKGPQKDQEQVSKQTEDTIPPVHSQKPAPAPIGAGGGSSGYVGKSFNLSAKTVDEYRQTFHAIPDLTAALRMLDADLAGRPPKQVYGALLARLNGMHQNMLEARAAKRPKPRRSGNRVIGGGLAA